MPKAAKEASIALKPMLIKPEGKIGKEKERNGHERSSERKRDACVPKEAEISWEI